MAASVHAQPGSLDPTFNPDDLGFGSGNGAGGTVRASVVQPDGRVIIAGYFSTYATVSVGEVVRLNTDGSIDPSFAYGDVSGGGVLDMVLQPDGRVLIAGEFTSVQGQARPRIARLNSDGTLDASFAPGSGPNGKVVAMALQPDGAVLIAGWFTSYAGAPRANMARVLTTGALDSTFDPGLGPVGIGANLSRIALQADGRAVVVGQFNTFNGTTSPGIVRLNGNGSIDGGFSPGNGTGTQVHCVTLQPDGRILIGGNFNTFNGITRNRVARLMSDGSLDPSFLPGAGTDGSPVCMVLKADGRILIGGNYNSYDGVARSRIARLEDDGSLDLTFDPGAGAGVFWGGIPMVYSLSVLADDKVIVGGDLQKYDDQHRLNILRIHPDGAPDASFDPQTGANSNVSVIEPLPDGRLIIAGVLHTYDGVPVPRIARLLPDGDLDTTFTPGAGPNSSALSNVLMQSDGKLVCAGYMYLWNTDTCGRIVRLNEDGTQDPTFSTAIGANNNIYAAALLPDGRILIAGAFTQYDGQPAPYVTRLLPNGSLDPTFDPGAGADTYIQDMALQPDGSVVLVGEFTTFDGQPANHVVRLEVDGSIDTTFAVSTNYEVRSVALQPDGAILIGGAFSQVNGTSRTRIARVLPDGTVDTTFDPGVGPNGWVEHIEITASGNILITGSFSEVDGVDRGRVARLLNDGSLDLAYNAGTGADNRVQVIAELPDGRAMVGGEFLSYDGVGRNRIARLQSDGSVAIPGSISQEPCVVYPNPSAGIFTLETVDGAWDSWSVMDLEGRTVIGGTALRTYRCTIDLSAYPKGAYVLRVDGRHGRWTTALIVQ